MTTPPDVPNPGMASTEAFQTLLESQKLSEMIMGFRITQIIYVAAKLGIADLLKNGPEAVDTLAEMTHTHAPSLYRLLRALASIGILTEDGQGRFTLTPRGALLQAGVPGSQRGRALVFGEASRWRSWGELLYSVTTGEPAFRHLYGMDDWDYKAQDPELNASFNDHMTTSTILEAASVVASYDFSGVGTLVDVGGGHGALISAILQANAQLHGILCDASHVVADSPLTLERAGVLDRCEIVPCNFFSSVPAGGDAYILKWIIHDWNDEQALEILKICHRAMPAHGRLLLVESVILPGNDPDPAKLMDLQMLLMFGGRERTEAEFRALLGKAGFKLTKIIPTQGLLSIIEGVPV